MQWRRKWQPTLVFLPGESQGREAWWAAVYAFAQESDTTEAVAEAMALIQLGDVDSLNKGNGGWKAKHAQV